MSIITPQDLNSLEPLDHDWVQQRLAEYPFVQIDGVTNARTLGDYVISRNTSHEIAEAKTRPKQMYRSAEVSGITEKGEHYTCTIFVLYINKITRSNILGRSQLKDLNIKKIFDLRSDTEMHKYDTPIPIIENVEVVHTPVFQTEDYSPEVMAKYVNTNSY